MKTILLLAAAAFGLSAARPSKTARPTALPDGSWGGNHIAITVGATGSKIEFDCAHGHIDGAFVLDAAGEFELSGTFSKERGGPIRRDDREQPLPAVYSGRVDGDRMTLTIRLRDAKETLGDFTLGRDKTPRLVKCL
jgi:hypothetical protein